MPITYRHGNDLDLDQVIELYIASTLGERRPVGERERMAEMLRHGNLVITAWDAEKLIGIARSLTDFAYVAYLSDLAVHLDYQKQGIGLELIRRSQQALHPNATLILLAAPAAEGYYPQIGFKHHPHAWYIKEGDLRDS